jgi:hypothetical protein
MPRTDTYLGRYMAALAIPGLYEQVREDYTETERQREVIDALIQQQRQDLANLEEIFRARPVDTAALTQVLAQQGALDRRAVEEARQTFTAAELGRLSDLATSNQAAAYQAAEQLAAEKSLTSAQREQIAGLFEQLGAEDIAGDVRRLQATERGVSTETRRAMTSAERALQDLQMTAPSGARGGARGADVIAERRTRAVAEKGATFSTDEDAFQGALAALEDGRLDRGDFETEADFNAALRVYNEAKEAGAYRNDQRSMFEASLLDARARLAELEARAERIAAPAGLTREQEIARRQLEARGYDFSKPYVRAQKSPYYGAMVAADEIVAAAIEGAATADPGKFSERGVDSIVVPSTKAQRLARELVVQIDQAGQPFKLKQAERQLRKTLSGDELQEALAFALAFRRSLDEGLSSAEAAAMKAEERAGEKAIKEAQKVAASAEKAAVKSARDAFMAEVDALQLRTPRPEEILVEDVAPPKREPAPRAPEPAPEPPAPAPPSERPIATDERLQAAYQDPTRTEEQRRLIAAELERRGAEVPTLAPAEESDAEFLARYGLQ